MIALLVGMKVVSKQVKATKPSTKKKVQMIRVSKISVKALNKLVDLGFTVIIK